MDLARHPTDLRLAPVQGEFSEAVDEPLLLYHGQVALPALLLAAVVVPHRPRHLERGDLLAAHGAHVKILSLENNK